MLLTKQMTEVDSNNFQKYEHLPNDQLRHAALVASVAAQRVPHLSHSERLRPTSSIGTIGLRFNFKPFNPEDQNFVLTVLEQLASPLKSLKWNKELKKFQETGEDQGQPSGYADFSIFMFALDRLDDDDEYYALMKKDPRARVEYVYFSEDLTLRIGPFIGLDGILTLRQTDPLRLNALALARLKLERMVGKAETYTDEETDELLRNYEEAVAQGDVETFGRLRYEIFALVSAESRLAGFDMGVENYRFALRKYLSRKFQFL